MLEARPGICIRCDARGLAGAACETRSCKKMRVHLLPEEYAERASDPAILADPMIGRVIDDWLVVDLLGRGGFGQVYLVLQLPIFLKAALKVLHRDPVTQDETPAQALARRAAAAKFTGEAQALATLTHPGIVRLLKFGMVEAAPYLVMEFAPGRVLAAAMESDPGGADVYRPENALHILRQLVNALEAAHLQGIVHRDVKPANIVLQSLPGDPFFVRVLDFGIAKFLSEGSKTSLSAGTPIYMAPEQFDRAGIGPWSDLYAVGVLAYELIFGQPPFGASTVERVLARKLAPDADPLRDIRGRVHPGIENFFALALARRPQDRFASATELRAALDRLFAAVQSVPRATLLAFGRPPEDELRASFAPTGDYPSGLDHAKTDLDLGSKKRGGFPPDTRDDPGAPSNDTTTPRRQRLRLWALGLAAATAGGVGVVLASGPSQVAPSADVVAVVDSEAAGDVSATVIDTAEAPSDTPLAPSPADTQGAQATTPEVASAADMEADATAATGSADDVALTASDTAAPPADTTDTAEVQPPTSLADASPDLDTRRPPTTRPRDAAATTEPTRADTSPPVPDIKPVDPKPDVRETRPYSFVD